MLEAPQDNSAQWARVESSDIWLEIVAPWLQEQIEMSVDDLVMIDPEKPGAADKRAMLQGKIFGLRAVLFAPRNEQEHAKFLAEMMRQEEEEEQNGRPGVTRRKPFRRPGR